MIKCMFISLYFVPSRKKNNFSL